MHRELNESLGVIYILLRRLNETLTDMYNALYSAERFVKNADIPLMTWDDAYFQQLYYSVRNVRIDAKNYLDALDGVIAILQATDSRIEEILTTLKPYIKDAIFSDKNYYSIMVYNLAAYNIYESSSITFKEIEYQLSGNDADAIQVLSDNAKQLKLELELIMGQIKKGTIC